MPGWHDATLAQQKSGDVRVLGIVQEQHGDRAQLFMQWKQMNGPVMVDSLNLLGVTAVPITLLLDETGTIVARARRPKELDAFLAAEQVRAKPLVQVRPDLAKMTKAAKTAAEKRTLADALFLFGEDRKLDAAVTAYREAVALDPTDAKAQFRLGVALRRRYETDQRRGTDFGAGVDAWRSALKLDPNNYIWRRRIQQYGPALAKPYPFYDWVATAQQAIVDRGDTPIALSAPLTDSESLARADFEMDVSAVKNPDPNGTINPDSKSLIRIETAVAPAVGRGGRALRVHIALRPDAEHDAHWNNEAEPLRLWLDAPNGWKLNRLLCVIDNAKTEVSEEVRRVEVEVQIPEDAQPARLRGYALYNVCEGAAGTCRFLRQNFVIELLP